MHKKLYKFMLILICMVMAINIAACKGTESSRSQEQSSFDVKVAENLIDNYMLFLMKGEKESAMKFYTEELAKASAKNPPDELMIRGYNVEEINEVGTSGIFKIKVTRSSPSLSYSELDEYTVKVTGEGETYKITEASNIPQREAYMENGSLRIRSKNNVKTNLLIDKGGIPGYSFSKDDKANISKLIVPKEGFGPISFSFSGENVAVSTKGKDSFAALVKIDESMAVQGQEDSQNGQKGGGGGGGAQPGESNKNAREVPIGKEITSLDLLRDAKIDFMTFSPNEKLVLIQYTKNTGGTCIRVYRGDSGDLIPYKFEDNFPVDKVDITFSSFNKEALNFEVIPKSQKEAGVRDVSGKWQMDTKEFKVKKM